MTARDTIADIALRHGVPRPGSARCPCGALWSANHQADAFIAAVRAMSRDELTELRPDIATEYHAPLDTAATRGDYLLNRLRAHLAAQEAS